MDFADPVVTNEENKENQLPHNSYSNTHSTTQTCPASPNTKSMANILMVFNTMDVV